MKTQASFPLLIITIFGLGLLLPIVGLYQSWCALILYNWFALPIGSPEIDLPGMWGLRILSWLVVPRMSTESFKDDLLKPFLDRLLAAALFPLGCVAVGWCINAWMTAP